MIQNLDHLAVLLLNRTTAPTSPLQLLHPSLTAHPLEFRTVDPNPSLPKTILQFSYPLEPSGVPADPSNTVQSPPGNEQSLPTPPSNCYTL